MMTKTEMLSLTKINFSTRMALSQVGRLSKCKSFCAPNISVWKFCANKMGNKPKKQLKIDPKKVKTMVICSFLCSKPKSCTISQRFCATVRSHLLETLMWARLHFPFMGGNARQCTFPARHSLADFCERLHCRFPRNLITCNFSQFMLICTN